MISFDRRIAAIAVVLAVSLSHARADVVLSGPDSNAGSYSTSALSTLAGGTTVNYNGLTGISLWNMLDGANASSSTSPIYGGITTSTPVGDNGKNAILRYYLVGTNATGQQSVVSLGEIDPFFGGTQTVAPFVAYQNTGSGLLAEPDLIVPGQSARDLTNLTSLQLEAVPALPTGAGGESSTVQLSGSVTNPGSYTLTALQNDFTPVTVSAGGDSYTGVPLWNFLNPSDSNVNAQIFTTQGTDGYEVVTALAEVDPNEGGNPDDILPYADTGGAFPGDGVARIIFPNDDHQGRWVSNVDAINVSEVPEPGSLALVLVGVAGVAGIRRRLTRVA